MSIVDSLGSLQERVTDNRSASTHRLATFEIADLLAVPEAAWADLAGRAIEPNPFFHPAWARAVARHAEGKSGARALLAWDAPARTRLIGLLPVVSAWRALRIPIPVFVAWQAYAPLTTPLFDRDRADLAARGLIAAAAKAGAMALLLPMLAEEGPAASALRGAIAEFNLAPYAFDRHQRARLDATQYADVAINSLGGKKVKELRRQRNRLADSGDVAFKIAAAGEETAAALEAFLSLEAAGWKGTTGTALGKKAGDSAFIRSAVPDMAASGAAEMATLSCGDAVVAAGVLLRHFRRAYFFKIAYDESAAKTSPGVQLTLDITRGLCADGAIDDADSTTISGHPMIDHIWRSRLAISDLLLPTQAGRLPLALFAALIGVRSTLCGAARSIFHLIRSLKGKHP
ncbi:MAG TPA: GNAT family N-acetyltransferase [Xanthobacteraceae bacterium]